MRASRFELGLLTMGSILVGLPVLSLLVTTPPSGFRALSNYESLSTFLLSLLTSSLALLLVAAVGTPVAWALVPKNRWGFRLWIQVCMVMPPAVVGIGLLRAFGAKGWLAGTGVAPFTTVSVVVAQSAVAAPFYILATRSGFMRVQPSMILVAKTLGASPYEIWRRVILPMARPGLFAGAILAWLRAMGEFGATLIFAGNRPGMTRTAPLQVYSLLEVGLDAASAVALGFAGFVLMVLLAFRFVLGDLD